MVDKSSGTLYLVGTPIGNLGDITLRAIETLKKVDLIAAEDTRQTRKLLNHLGIEKPLTSYFEHNKLSKGPQLIAELLGGKEIALVSDAGMPGVSDPGTDLVKACIEANLKITVIPGPSALLTGLVASGLDTNGFVFLGFFPREKSSQKKLLLHVALEQRTLIFYESPHRLLSSLQVLRESLGDRRCCVARELTKLYEDYRRGTFSQVLASYEKGQIKGEVTVMVEGFRTTEKPESPTWEEIDEYIAGFGDQGLSTGEVAKKAARQFGLPKREIYNRLVAEDDQEDKD